MIEFVRAKKSYLLLLAVLFVFISLSETTYSLFLQQDSTSEFSYNTGSLDLEFKEDSEISLNNTFPTIDSEGMKQEPYKLTIKNVGNLPQLFTLKMISDTDNGIAYNYIKVAVDSYLPHTLASINNIIVNDILLYPEEEKTFSIRIWLDYNTPNSEIGKSFTAKIIATGQATYKTLDKSGANHPTLSTDMLPINYNETDKSWHLADANNIDTNNMWYDYNDKLWANSLIVKDSSKYIFDATRNNDLSITDVKVNNGNLIIDDNALDIGQASYSYDNISQFFRVKITDMTEKYTYFISNGNISYYYDYNTSKFVFKNGTVSVSSNEFTIEKGNWYIIGYTYNGSKIVFYANGTKIGEANVSGPISRGTSFKIGTNAENKVVSKLTVGDAITYGRILTDQEIATNYKLSMNLITDGLVSAYQNFQPMTLKEYYLNKEVGTKIAYNDMSALYVWIPRYKYRVWNITGEANIDSYNAYTNGISIIFENAKEKTGIISCKDDKCFSDLVNQTVVSAVDNSKYYTHPAFTNNDTELLGFWVSKYEASQNDNTLSFVPNVSISTNQNFEDYYTMATKDNRQIITNTEWGAVAYLTHSTFGICNTSKCNPVASNKTTTSGKNLEDSTTGNMYGVFDMAGGASEYTRSLISTESTNNNYQIYQPNTFILGDATKELQLANSIWNQNTATSLEGENVWIIRGGNTTNSASGMLAYSKNSEISKANLTTRVTIK